MSGPSSPGQGSSTSASTRPESATSGCAKPTLGGAGSCTPGSPASPSTPTSGQLALSLPAGSMSSPEGSPARAPQRRGSGPGSTIPKPLCGEKCGGALASYDPASSCWRTSRISLLSTEGTCGERWSGTWPRSGMTRSGIAFPLLPSVPLTSVTGSSPLLPTPTVNDAANLSAPSQEDRNGPGLPTVVRLLPTPMADEGGTNQSPSERAAVRPQLGTLVKLLPTPTSTLGSAGSSADRFGFRGDPTVQGIARGLKLPPPPSDAAHEWSGGSTSPRSDAGKPSTGPRPTLSPDFVGWMMGTPQCTVCGAEWTDPGCQHSATAYTSTPPGSSGSTS